MKNRLEWYKREQGKGGRPQPRNRRQGAQQVRGGFEHPPPPPPPTPPHLLLSSPSSSSPQVGGGPGRAAAARAPPAGRAQQDHGLPDVQRGGQGGAHGRHHGRLVPLRRAAAAGGGFAGRPLHTVLRHTEGLLSSSTSFSSLPPLLQETGETVADWFVFMWSVTSAMRKEVSQQNRSITTACAIEK